MAVPPPTTGLDKPSLILHDEDGQAFTFRPLRALRDEADLFLIAEREGASTLHVLKREGDAIGLVRDDETLRRVALRLEILRRAMEGELVEWSAGEEGRFFGVFHKGEVGGQPYLLAADLADPATVLAFTPTKRGLELLDDRRVVLVREQLRRVTEAWDIARPNLEAATLGLRHERVEVRDAAGRSRAYETAGRFFFQGRDLLFLKAPEDPGQAFPVEVKDGGRMEPVKDAGFLDALEAHLQSVVRQGRRA